MSLNDWMDVINQFTLCAFLALCMIGAAIIFRGDDDDDEN